MAKYIRRKQLEKQTVTRHFAMKLSTSARVDFSDWIGKLGPAHEQALVCLSHT